jgi:hypothetical protein
VQVGFVLGCFVYVIELFEAYDQEWVWDRFLKLFVAAFQVSRVPNLDQIAVRQLEEVGDWPHHSAEIVL